MVAKRVAQHSKSQILALRLYQALKLPFSEFNNEEKRRMMLLDLGIALDKGQYAEYSLPAIEVTEPDVPWQERFLNARKTCYKNVGDPRAAQAERDWNQFVREQSDHLENLAFLKEIPAEESQPAGYATEAAALQTTRH